MRNHVDTINTDTHMDYNMVPIDSRQYIIINIYIYAHLIITVEVFANFIFFRTVRKQLFIHDDNNITISPLNRIGKCARTPL